MQGAAHSVAAPRPRGEVVSVLLARLAISSSFREAGVNEDHVRRLAGLGGRWPPILVNKGNGQVIDGVHRVAAARLLGLERIDASLFDGGPDEAMIEFVRRNVHHGLPLTLRERKRAVHRVLQVHPEWSDRRIAEICALSPKTVGRLRPDPQGSSSDGGPKVDVQMRLGRDNKSRPVNSAPVRARVVEALKEHPDASLRSIAAAVGVSPETVRLVRMNMSSPVATEAAVEPTPPEAPSARRGFAATLPAGGRGEQDELTAWLDRTSVGHKECQEWAGSVPLSRVSELVEEARRRSGAWLEFARSLDELSPQRR